MRVKLMFTECLLGTLSGNPDIAEEFIASKHPDGPQDDELHAELPKGDVEKSSTIFPREGGKPFIWDYQIKGFLKDACSMLRRVKDTKSSKLTAYKKVIDGLIFPGPRKIFIDVVGDISWCERPLRAQTAQGERIALARSESVPVGSSITFDITCLADKYIKLVEEWLDYGSLRGLGQWRNSGKGRFTWELVSK